MPTYLIFKKVDSMLASEFLTVYHTVWQALNNEEAKYLVVLRKYLNTHFFYSVYDIFMCIGAP
jgi:hypothetical protein